MVTLHEVIFFFFNDPATTEIYPLSLHDALPISFFRWARALWRPFARFGNRRRDRPRHTTHHRRIYSGRHRLQPAAWARSEEHTSELQSPCNLVCRLLLEKKKTSAPCTLIL